MSFKLKEIFRETDGATAIEYGLIASLFVMGTIAGLNSIGSPLSNLLGSVLSVVIGITSITS